MDKYEYRTISYFPTIEELNRFGKEGWELCCSAKWEGQTGEYLILYLKRKIIEE